MEVRVNLPYNEEAERACIGAMLVSTDAAREAVEKLSPEDFYNPKLRNIFIVIRELLESQETVSIPTVAERLEALGILKNIGGYAFLSNLSTYGIPSKDITKHINTILEYSARRELISTAEDIMKQAMDTKVGIDDLVETVEKDVFEITEKVKGRKQNVERLLDIMHRVLSGLEKIQADQRVYTGIPTGFTEFDNMTSGLQKGELIVIAARPSMGKTAFAVNIARNVALHHNAHVLFFSLEMSKEQLLLRFLSLQSGIELSRLRSANIKKDEWEKLVNAAGTLASLPIYIDDTPAIPITEIKSVARKLHAKIGLNLIIIDHLQLISTNFNTKDTRTIKSRNDELSYISRNLKALAKELDVPVLVLSQLSRAVEKRQDKRPLLSDLRESGAIEQDADLVAFLYREDYYDRTVDTREVEVIIQKQRNGPIGTIKLAFYREYGEFLDLEKVE